MGRGGKGGRGGEGRRGKVREERWGGKETEAHLVSARVSP